MLTTTATSMLRTSLGRSSGTALQPIVIRATAAAGAACPYSTSSSGLMSMAAKSRSSKPTSSQLVCAHRQFSSSTVTTPSTPSQQQHLLIRFRTQQQQRRSNASATPRSNSNTVHDVDASAAAAAAAAQTAAHPESPPLDWNTFFKLRKTRRRVQLTFSVVMAAAASFGGAAVLTTGLAEPLVSQLPVDPLFAMIGMVISCAGLGWLAGPSIGSLVFNAVKRNYKGQMAIKESQFFARVKKHRVDPSTSSMGNPVPDFYGEKISSVAGYRQWLKDQRNFNKKRTLV